MHAVVDVVYVRGLSGQSDLDRFQALRLSARAAHSVVRGQSHPAVILNMCPVLNPTLDVIELNLDSLEALRLAARAGGHSVTDIILPPDILDMGLVLDRIGRFVFIDKPPRRRSRGSSALLDQFYLDRFQSI